MTDPPRYPENIPNLHNPSANYYRGKNPELYEFFAMQPKDTLIASLSRESDNLPTFSRRSVLTSREHSVPYNLGYIVPFRNRTGALIRAFLHPYIHELRSFLADYEVDFILVDRRDLFKDTALWWVHDFPRRTAAAWRLLRRSRQPAIVDLLDECAVFKSERFFVLPTECIEGSPSISK